MLAGLLLTLDAYGYFAPFRVYELKSELRKDQGPYLGVRIIPYALHTWLSSTFAPVKCVTAGIHTIGLILSLLHFNHGYWTSSYTITSFIVPSCHMLVPGH